MEVTLPRTYRSTCYTIPSIFPIFNLPKYIVCRQKLIVRNQFGLSFLNKDNNIIIVIQLCFCFFNPSIFIVYTTFLKIKRFLLSIFLFDSSYVLGPSTDLKVFLIGCLATLLSNLPTKVPKAVNRKKSLSSKFHYPDGHDNF